MDAEPDLLRETLPQPAFAAEAASKSRFWLLFDPSPERPRWGIPETVVLLLWCAAAAFAVAQHVPWADEEQAWLLADGVGWSRLFLHSLHYEGTGGLWHALLKILQAGHISFTGMRWVAAGIEAAAMAVLLLRAPLPLLVRWLLAFTFFLLYQDAVVARSYCLFAILAFTAAALLRGARARPWLTAAVLGLMANLSLHAAVASLGFAATAWLRRRSSLRANPPATALLLLLWAGAAATMAPAVDVDFGAGNNIHRSLAKAEQRLGFHAAVPQALPLLPMAGLRPMPVPVHERHGFTRTWNKVSRALAVVTYPLSSSRALAFALVLAVFLQAAAQAGRGKRLTEGGSLGLAGLLPYGFMLLLFSSLYLAPRHAGTVFTGFVAAAWLTWPTAASSTAPAGRRLWLARAAALLLVLVSLQQIGWSIHALAAEHAGPYAPGRMTADYLHARGADAPGTNLAGYYYGSIDPLLYFPRNLYGNQPPHRYWLWSTTLRDYDTVEQELARHPAFIVIGGYENGPEAEITRDWQPVTPPVPGVTLNDLFQVRQYFAVRGYRTTHVFCGKSSMRAGYAERLCDTVMEPGPVSTPARITR